MLFLREQLDDPEAAPCGRCDNCGGLSLSTEVSAAAVTEAQERLARPGVPLPPRKMWPTGLDRLGMDLRGKVAEQALEGRAVARLTDLGYGQALRELFREGTPDGPVPVPLVQAVIEVLGDWRPEVDAVVEVESASRPELVGSLADGLSRYLQVPLLGRWAVMDPEVPPGRGQANSAQRVAAVSRRSGLEAEPGALEGRRVLLVDDLLDTGWSTTLAARAVLRAGAVSVQPLVLAVRA
jgi:ATP-dependent DNA helicase RecQ